MPEIVTSSTHQHYLSIAVYWGPLILQTRQIAKSVSRPLKRCKPVALATWTDLVRSHHAFCTLALHAHRDAARLDLTVSARAHAAQVKSFGSTAASHFESLVFAHLGCTAILFRKLKQWAATQRAQIDSSTEFAASCGAIGRTLEDAFVEGLLVLVRRLQMPGVMTLKVLATDFAGLSLAARLLDVLLEVTTDLPHAEIGGHTNLPLRVKLEAVDLCVQRFVLVLPRKLNAVMRTGSSAGFRSRAGLTPTSVVRRQKAKPSWTACAPPPPLPRRPRCRVLRRLGPGPTRPPSVSPPTCRRVLSSSRSRGRKRAPAMTSSSTDPSSLIAPTRCLSPERPLRCIRESASPLGNPFFFRVA